MLLRINASCIKRISSEKNAMPAKQTVVASRLSCSVASVLPCSASVVIRWFDCVCLAECTERMS